MILKIICEIFLILVCAATLAGRPIFDMDEHMIHLTGLVAFIGLIFLSHWKGRIRIIDILFLLAIVYGLSNQREINVDLTVKYLSMMGVWFFVKEYDSPRFVFGLFLVVMLTALIHTFVACLQSFGVLSNQNYFFKTTGLFNNPGPFGCYLSFALATLLPSVFFYFRLLTIQQKVFSLLAVLLLLFGLVLSDSRAAYLAVIVTVVVCLFLKYRSSIRLKTFHVGLYLLLFSGTMLALYLYRPSSANARLGVWKITANAVTQEPLFGYGTGGFKRTYMFNQADYLTNANENMRRNADEEKTAYNLPLELLYEQGIVGFLLWCSVVFLSMKEMLGSSVKRKLLLLFPIISFLVFSSFSYPNQIWGLICPFIAMLSLGGNYKPSIRVQRKTDRIIIYGMEVSLLSALLLLFVNRVLIDSNLIRYHKFDMDYWEVESYHTLNRILYHSPSLLYNYADNQILTDDYEAAISTITQLQKYSNSYTIERNLAFSFEITGDTAKALDHYKIAQNMCPGYLEPLFSQFLIYEAKGDSIAVPLAKEIVEFTPKISNSRTESMKSRTIQFFNSNH